MTPDPDLNTACSLQLILIQCLWPGVFPSCRAAACSIMQGHSAAAAPAVWVGGGGGVRRGVKSIAQCRFTLSSTNQEMKQDRKIEDLKTADCMIGLSGS